MTIYLIAINKLYYNYKFVDNFSIEEKLSFRVPIVSNYDFLKTLNFSRVYSSTDVASLTASTYVADNNYDVYITKNLDSIKIGDLKNQSLKALTFFQNNNYNFKQPNGESILEASIRINNFIKKIINTNENSLVFLPKRSLYCFLTKHLEPEKTVNDLTLLIKDSNVVYGNYKEIDIIKLTIKNNELNFENISKGEVDES